MRVRRTFMCLGIATVLVSGACQSDETATGPTDAPAASFAKRSGGVEDLSPAQNATGRYLIQVRGNKTRPARDLIESLGGTVEIDLPEIGIVVAGGLSGDAADRLAADKRVGGLEAEMGLQLIPKLDDLQVFTETLPEDVAAEGHDPTTAFFFAFQWDMHIIDVADAWNAGYNDASGSRVAVLDTGIDPNHIDMNGRVDAASSIAFVRSVSGSGPPWGDDNFHGTHVSGIISTNGIGTSGVAPHATLIAVKICDWTGSCPTGAILAGLVHAVTAGANVANLSLSGAFPKAGLGIFVAAFNNAVNFANRNGVLVVSAAGNQAQDLQHFGNMIRIPCQSGAGMCISATGPTDVFAGYSNFGANSISVAAPGGDIVFGSSFADFVLAPCSSLSVFLPPLGISCTTASYLFVIGTSQATPHVSGAAALLGAQGGEGMKPAQLRSQIQNTSDDLGKRGVDPFYGKGRLNVGNLLGQ